MTRNSVHSISLKLPFSEALFELEDALQRKGLHILHRTDVRDLFRIRLHVDFRKYVVLHLSLPGMAYRAMIEDLNAGMAAVLPVAVYEAGEGTIVVFPSVKGLRRALGLLAGVEAPFQELEETLLEALNEVRKGARKLAV